MRVSARTDCHVLAGSIIAAIDRGQDVTITAIGPFPVAQAVKAVCGVNRMLESSRTGRSVGIVPALETREILDRPTGDKVPWVVSVLRLKVYDDHSG